MLLGAFLWFYFRRRQWQLQQLTLPFATKDVLRGLGVLVFGYLLYVAAWLLAIVLFPGIEDVVAAMPSSGGATLWAIVLVSLINPLFEELIWLGYAVNGPAHRRPERALLWSLLPRVLIHAYQGPLALISILPLGLWYLRYYFRTGRLWPIVLAHAAQDAIGLLAVGRTTAG